MNDNCENPINHAIDKFTKDKSDRRKLVDTIRICAIIVAAGIAIGLLLGISPYVYKFINNHVQSIENDI